MDDPELLKEFIRDAYMKGALDLGSDRKFLEGFLRIFAGEMESLLAIEHASWLSMDEKLELLKLAKPTQQAARDLSAWAARIK